MLDLLATAMPWLAMAVILLAFSLADDLPDARVRRVFAFIAAALVALGALSWFWASSTDATILLVAAGPAAFLIVHHLLRTAFKRWKGDEPVLAATGSSGTGRFFYEKGVRRRVTALDYVYSFLLGAGMLLTAAPAIAFLGVA